VFFKVFSTVREGGTLPSAHASSQRALHQHAEEQENILEMVQRSVAPLVAREDFLRFSVFHERVYGEYCMMTACIHFTHSMCKIYTQGTAMRQKCCHWLHTNQSPIASVNSNH
jgi:hypothetical protein